MYNNTERTIRSKKKDEGRTEVSRQYENTYIRQRSHVRHGCRR